MWFVFPQISGLGQSPMSQRYAIGSLEEARAYLEHPVLGPRLTECTRIVSELDTGSAEEIFGGIDAIKLRSDRSPCSAGRTPEDALFPAVLNRPPWWPGRPGHRSPAVLEQRSSGSSLSSRAADRGVGVSPGPAIQPPWLAASVPFLGLAPGQPLRHTSSPLSPTGREPGRAPPAACRREGASLERLLRAPALDEGQAARVILAHAGRRG